MASDKVDGDTTAPAWSVRGFLQKTSRHNIREDRVQDDASVHVFRVSEDADKENILSPLPIVRSPTLMEIKDCGKDVFLEIADLSDKLKKIQEEVDSLRTSRLIVDCVECIQRVAQILNKKILRILGRLLQNVDDEEKNGLLAGPFAKRKNEKHICGTYFDLLHWYDSKPSARVDEYLRRAELKVVQIFQHACFEPQRTSDIRIMFRNFLANGKGLRDVESHIVMIKDREAKEVALRRIEQYGKMTLDQFGLLELFPMVVAGIHVLRNGELAEENDVEDVVVAISKQGVEMLEPNDTSFTKVRVTFTVCKKLPLLHIVGLFGNLQRLGNNDPEKALPMACTDGLLWQKVVDLPRGVELIFSFVVLKKIIGTKKWAVVEGPVHSLEAHVGASSTMLLEAKWSDANELFIV